MWKTNGKIDGTARSKEKKKDELGGSPTFQVKYDSGLNSANVMGMKMYE